MIIGFCGYARSGKDTCANLAMSISTNKTMCKFAFADSLRQFVYELDSFLPEINMHYRTAIDSLGYETAKTKFPCIRKHLVDIDHSARLHIDPNIWINSLKHKIKTSNKDIYYITDVRYANEVEAIISEGGTIVYVDRPGIEPAKEIEKESIQGILTNYDVLIVHNIGSLESLKMQLEELL